MVDVALVFPYFNDGRSPLFKFPPLGIGYIASYLRKHGYSVEIVDCTFLTYDEAIERLRRAKPRVVGIYSMLSMVRQAKQLAADISEACEVLVAGGPMPSAYPSMFLDRFDFVCQGEGEETMHELLEALDRGGVERVRGLWIGPRQNGGRIKFTGARPLIRDLDALPFPARDLYDNEAYKRYYRINYGYTITSMVASRGCPFSCDFCWRPDYGRVYRVRSPSNIVDEMEEIRERYGYERIWFADEIFIVDKRHVKELCREIIRRRIDVGWECLSRVDLIDDEVARLMKRAGCYKVIFGLESGDDHILKLMNKRITVEQSRKAVKIAKKAGLKVGAFFILGYPGENNETMLRTIKLASRLPLDYFSMTVPYPLPGTKLYERVKDRMEAFEWEKPFSGYDHKLLFKHDFSIEKLRYGMWKAKMQAAIRRKLGPLSILARPLELYTDYKFKRMR